MNQSQVLWIRIGALGDLLIATAALKEIEERFSDKKIWVMGPRLWIELLDPTLWPNVNGIVVLDKKFGTLYRRAESQWSDHGETHPLSWFYQNVDVTVNHRLESYRFAWGPWLAHTPIRIGSCPWPMKWLYTHYSSWLGKDPDLHERDWHLLLAFAGDPKLAPTPTCQAAREQAARFIADDLRMKKWQRQGLPPLKKTHPARAEDLVNVKAGRYILINPTSSRREKAWPAERFRELTRELGIQFRDFEILVIGAPHETDWLNEVMIDRARMVQPRHLADLIEIVAEARALITNTSSMQFIASGTQTPCLTLMGRTNPRQWGPLGEKSRYLCGHVPSDFKGNIFEEDLAALKNLETAAVIESAAQFIAQISAVLW